MLDKLRGSLMFKQLKRELQKKANPEKAKILQRFFKTGKGQYGEGDVFLGITVPEQRKTAKKFLNLPLEQIQELLQSKIHEHRLVSLLILVEKYQKADEKNKREIYNFYLKNTKKVNNWDLVDLTAHKIVGDFITKKDKHILYKLARSNNLWERRIAMIATFAYIKDHDFKDAILIAEILLHDDHDLIHKAVGWVLREIGKKDQKLLEEFLDKHIAKMPRTTLRYSIERFPEKKRKAYLNKKI
jgi:3-methyladenine DNA glycosylase AlkD